MCQREVDGVDAGGVVLTRRATMPTADRSRGLNAEFGFKWRNESGNEVEVKGLGFPDWLGNGGVDQCRNNHGFDAVTFAGFVDPAAALLRLFRCVDKRDSLLLIRNPLELRKQAVADCFGSDGRAVGDEENSTH